MSKVTFYLMLFLKSISQITTKKKNPLETESSLLAGNETKKAEAFCLDIMLRIKQ